MSTASARATRNTATPAASQTTSGAGTEVIRGRLVSGAKLPTVTGRGRKAIPLPEWFVETMNSVLAGEGIYEFEGTPKEVISHKTTMVKKYVDNHNKSNPGKKIRASYVTVEGSLPSATGTGTDHVKVACVVEYLDSADER